MMKRQYFKIEFHCNYDYRRFVDGLKTVCSSIKIHRAEIGQLYFDVIGKYDPHCETKEEDVSGIIFNHRHLGIRLIKHLNRKPSPQGHWTGGWETV